MLLDISAYLLVKKNKINMKKLESLKYICKNFHGSQGGYQHAWLQDIILSDKEEYDEKELNEIIKEMEDY